MTAHRFIQMVLFQNQIAQIWILIDSKSVLVSKVKFHNLSKHHFSVDFSFIDDNSQAPALDIEMFNNFIFNGVFIFSQFFSLFRYSLFITVMYYF